MAASVQTKLKVVAIFGAIMPAPLVQAEEGDAAVVDAQAGERRFWGCDRW